MQKFCPILELTHLIYMINHWNKLNYLLLPAEVCISLQLQLKQYLYKKSKHKQNKSQIDEKTDTYLTALSHLLNASNEQKKLSRS